MDSKVRTKAIFIVSLLCLLLFATVALFNKSKQVKKTEPSAQALDEETTVPGRGEELSWAQLQAFLQDPGFFDTPEEVGGHKTPNAETELHIVVDSAKGDIRVCVLDESSNLVTGYDFEVLVEEEGYLDLDEDGIILIPDVAPGEYFVSLQPKVDFHVPYEPVLINVTEELSYQPLKDVAYRIGSTSGTSGITYVTDADMGQDESNVLYTGNNTGIDVSAANGEIDWLKVKNAGIDFAIICCGYRDGNSGKLFEDSLYKENMENAKAAGLEVGIYFESQAINSVEAVEEASAVLALLEDTKLALPVFLTFGEHDGRAKLLTAEMRAEIADAFGKTLESEGLSWGIFGSKSMLTSRVSLESLKRAYLWSGEYRKEPTMSVNIQYWQYSDGGRVDGINGWVNLDLRTK